MITLDNKKKVTLFILLIGIFVFLVLVLIPAIVTWVDYSCFKNDMHQAELMTDVIEPYTDDNLFQTSLDAYDIRTLVTTSIDDDFDFSTKSKNSAFFYDKKTHTVRAYRFDELEVNACFLDCEEKSSITPEEIFGDGLYMISYSGSLIAETIHFIRLLASEEKSFNDWEKYVKNIENHRNRDFLELYNLTISEAELNAVQYLIDFFNPTRTLYVNNERWLTNASNEEAIVSIVFQEGVINIPEFEVSQEFESVGSYISLSHIVLPKTVLHIESNSFSNAIFSIKYLIVRSVEGLYVDSNALSGVESVLTRIEFFEVESLIDYSDCVEFSTDENSEIVFSFNEFNDLIINNGVTGYSVKQTDSIVIIYLYANEFLVGYATNAFTTRYYISEDDSYPYYTHISSKQTFKCPRDPVLSHGVFKEWVDAEGNSYNDGDSIVRNALTVFMVATNE